jgi:hypothetical protein
VLEIADGRGPLEVREVADLLGMSRSLVARVEFDALAKLAVLAQRGELDELRPGHGLVRETSAEEASPPPSPPKVAVAPPHAGRDLGEVLARLRLELGPSCFKRVASGARADARAAGGAL